MGDAGIAVLILLYFAVIVGTMAFWIVCLVEVVKLPDHAYRAAGKEKTTWILIVALVQFIGAVIWWFAARRAVKSAAAAYPHPPPLSWAGPPPGWYPDPAGSGRQAWWDGYRWHPPGS